MASIGADSLFHQNEILDESFLDWDQDGGGVQSSSTEEAKPYWAFLGPQNQRSWTDFKRDALRNSEVLRDKLGVSLWTLTWPKMSSSLMTPFQKYDKIQQSSTATVCWKKNLHHPIVLTQGYQYLLGYKKKRRKDKTNDRMKNKQRKGGQNIYWYLWCFIFDSLKTSLLLKVKTTNEGRKESEKERENNERRKKRWKEIGKYWLN